MASGRVVGLEALIRWNHPALGLLTADHFIGVAEISGLSERITRWVVTRSVPRFFGGAARGPGSTFPFSINVAGRELGSNALPILVRGAAEPVRHRASHDPRWKSPSARWSKEGEINNDVITELASARDRIVA